MAVSYQRESSCSSVGPGTRARVTPTLIYPRLKSSSPNRSEAGEQVTVPEVAGHAGWVARHVLLREVSGNVLLFGHTRRAAPKDGPERASKRRSTRWPPRDGTAWI